MPAEYTTAPIGSVILIDPNNISAGIDDNVVALIPSEIGAASDILRNIRRGQLLFAENFKSGIGAWLATGSGTIAQDTTMYLRNGAALKVTTPATASQQQGANLYLHLPPVSQLFVECWMGGQATTNCDSFGVMANYGNSATGSTLLETGLEYSVTNGKCAYYNNAGSWITSGNSLTNVGANLWQHFFLSLNITTGKYQKCLLSGQWTDLTAQSIIVGGAADLGYLQIQFFNKNSTSATAQSEDFAELTIAGILNLS
jgi:hypothetical protein